VSQPGGGAPDSALPPVLPPRIVWEPIVAAALAEDLGRAGDRTTDAVVPHDLHARAAVVARAAGTVAGLPVALAAFAMLDPAVEARSFAAEGQPVRAGTTLAEVRGPARALLTGERVALNLLGRTCGIATATRTLADLIEGTSARVTCTRKTTPGLRALEKYAVRAGGGSNHRFGLDDALLVKDNHIAVAGGVREAVLRARAAAGHMLTLELEVDTLEQLEVALELPVDAVLLDNMSPPTLARAVAMVAGRMVTEASGGIGPGTARAVAESGVDYISSGWLTHSAPALDVALDIILHEPSTAARA